ncbi:MAG: neutral/alkaline non-lysosomal ceramidase N-terminal domain-containing protein [Planctomycetota bacterium]|nr:neutral/alkaline non-lysosomal ceramidase N-terminal domain-containing protein [Planctomycetota bacterium]
MQHTVLLLATLGVLCVPCQAAEKESLRLRAGASAVDITPKIFPLNMPGGFNANMAESAHDPLYARALVLDDGTTSLAIVVVDNLGVAQEACEEAKTLAAQQCPIAIDKMLVSSTHTHSAPPSNAKDGPAPAVAYRQLLVAGMAASIVRAHAALRPASVQAAAHPLPEEVFNRRWYLKPGAMPPNPFGRMDLVKMNPGTNPALLDRPAGPTDPDITIVSVQDATSRKPLAVLANYSLHYVGGTPNAMVSADYYGEFVRLMRSRVRGDDSFVALMSNGTSGDINNIPFLVNRPPREPFEQVRIVAQKAADAAWHAWAGIPSHRPDVRLGMRQRQITLKLRHPTPQQIAEAQAVLAVKDPAARDKLPPLAEAYARRTLSLAEAADTLIVPLQTLRIGDLAMCAIPFETFVEIGLDLKKRSPFPQTMVIGIANGYNGYLPTPEQHQLGGYETWLGTCKVQEEASVILVNNALEMFAELQREK